MQNTDNTESKVITCPSGLSGAVRGLRVREERILTDRRLAKSGLQMDQLLSACWLETLDPGPYDFKAAAAPAWEQVLQGDRFFALLQIRALTYGDAYDFSVTCANEACTKRFAWSVGLDALPLRELTDTHRLAFTSSNRVETILPTSHKRAWFKLATGADEQRLARLRETQGNRALSSMLALRVVEVEGLKEPQKAAFLEDLPMRDANHLVAEFERSDCGVETSIDIECPHCLHVQGVDLPLDPGFLWPRAKAQQPSSQVLT